MFLDLFLINICFFIILLIFETLKPPSLNIDALSVRLIIVDSTPIEHLPPLSIYFNFFPNSSFTSEGCTELSFEEIFALGAAKG